MVIKNFCAHVFFLSEISNCYPLSVPHCVMGQICFSGQRWLCSGASTAADLDDTGGEIWVLQADVTQIRSDTELCSNG